MIDFILIILITHSIIFYIPMNVLRSNYVFPSYSKIKQDIINKKSKAYDGTIRRLNKKLVEMSQENNFQEEHEKIKNCIISLSAENVNEKAPI